MADLSNTLAGVCFKNPVTTSSGTCGFGRELNEFYDLSRLGGIFAKGTTLEPRSGNPTPRVLETPAGMINSVGLQNPGVEAVLKKELPWLTQFDLAKFVNIAGNTVEDYAEVAARLDGFPGLDGLELNISCPNVDGGLAFGSTPHEAEKLVRAVRRRTSLPLFVKLTPNTLDIRDVAMAVEQAGADALTVMNTLIGMLIDVERAKPLLSKKTGGLCGPATKPVALRMVYEVYHVTKLPIVGVGGITTALDAVEFLMAGASAIAVGSGNLVNPMITMEIIDGLNDWLDVHHYKSVKEIIGLANPR